MQRIYWCHIPLTEYCRLGKLNLFPEFGRCPHKKCFYNGRLRKHGFYSRSAITLDGIMTVWIQRYICPSCGHTVSALPSSLLPHFQYAISVIAWILHGLHELELSVSELVRRWPLPEVSFSRQQIQFINKRLRVWEPAYRQFLKVGYDSPLPIGALLLQHCPHFSGLESLAYSIYKVPWGPFLSK
jgi:hypothetical protein